MAEIWAYWGRDWGFVFGNALISDSLIVCNGITITDVTLEGRYVCHSLITQVLGNIFYYVSFPVVIGITRFPEDPEPLELWIFSGILFLFIYGTVIGLIVGKLRKEEK